MSGRCQLCGAEFPRKDLGRPRLFCSSACRHRAPATSKPIPARGRTKTIRVPDPDQLYDHLGEPVDGPCRYVSRTISVQKPQVELKRIPVEHWSVAA